MSSALTLLARWVVLVRDLGFNDDAADIAIGALRESMALVKPHGAEYNPAMNAATKQDLPPRGHSMTPGGGALTPPAPQKGTFLRWSLGKGVEVELQANAPLTPAHYRRLKAFIDMTEEAEKEDSVTSGPSSI